jgi:lysophospholipase L1-like esterase
MKKSRILGSVGVPGKPASLKPAGGWKVSVRVVPAGRREIRAVIDVPPPSTITVVGGRYAGLPDFKPDSWGGWTKGVALRGLCSQECTTRFALDPASLIVASGRGRGAVIYKRGRDYDADLEWGSVGRLSQGRIKSDQPVFISYRYVKPRLDSIILNASGKLALKRGTPHIATPRPPAMSAGETRLANVFTEGRMKALRADCLYPILETAYPEPPKPSPTVAECLLPKTVKRLRAGGTLNVLAWGDSVTDGGFLAREQERWQCQFVARLRKRFPKAHVKLTTEAWGGRNSTLYLAEPPGSIHNYKAKVLGAKPDLIVMEFVNDAGLEGKALERQYGRLLRDIKGIGAEWLILTPHYIRPDWMGLGRQKNIDEDPRPYVKSLRAFAAKNNVALADASLRYGRLWRQGIPYNTLMQNNINHPDARGMKLFADSLMALFPR